MKKAPEILNAITDVVLKYHPQKTRKKPKARRRAKKK